MRTQAASGSAFGQAADLYRHAGPISSLYLSLDAADDVRRIDLRWRHLRAELDTAGAPEGDLLVLDAQVATARRHPGPRVLAAFVANGVLLAAHLLDHCDEHDLSRYDSLPAAGPMLAWSQLEVRYLVVVTDHTGADITERRWPASPEAVVHVEGSNDEIVRTAAGGYGAWSQGRYQRRAVDSWEHNAAEVAATVAGLVDQTAAQLVLVTGDIRSVRMLHEALPAHVQPMVHVVEGSGTRDEEGWSPALEKHLIETVDRSNRAAATALLEFWRDQYGQGSAVTAGLRDTALALREARVATLLIAYDRADERRAWVGPDPQQLALTFHDLADLSVPVRRVPLADAFIAAALATGAEVRVVPADLSAALPDGVGSVLRFP